jgi:hypothetical protein
MYGDYRRIVMMGDGGTVTGIARPRRAVKPQSRFCGAPQARGLTAKARTERSSCRRNACRRRTLSERLSTRFYSYHMAWNFTEAYVFGAGFRAATLARAYFKSERGRG